MIYAKWIKKLAAWLDISQGEVIRRAIAEYEKIIINKDIYPNTTNVSIKKEIDTILQAATDAVWEDDIKNVFRNLNFINYLRINKTKIQVYIPSIVSFELGYYFLNKSIT